MISVGENIIRNKYLRGLKDRTQVQLVGIDLRIKSVLQWKEAGRLDFENRHRKISSCIGVSTQKGNVFFLKQGSYLIEFHETINVPLDSVAFIFPRSSLMRNGGVIDSSLFDPGYVGKMMAILNVVNTNGIYIEKGARVCQCIFIKTERPLLSGYSGVYQNESKK